METQDNICKDYDILLLKENSHKTAILRTLETISHIKPFISTRHHTRKFQTLQLH